MCPGRRERQATSAAPIAVDGGAWTNGHISSAIARQSAVAARVLAVYLDGLRAAVAPGPAKDRAAG